MKKLFAWSAALAIAATGLIAGVAPAQAAGKTLTYGVISTIRSYAASSGEIANKGPFYQAVYDTLIMQMPNGRYTGWLADKFTADKAGTTITLHIRKGVKFTDGAAVTPEAVKASIEAFQKGDSPRASDAASIASVSTKGENVIIKLSYPDPSIKWALSGAIYIQSPSTIGTDAAKKVPVGSGPYILNTNKTIVDSVYYYDPNPNYWNAKARSFDNLVIKVLSDPTAAVNALKTGAVDVMNIADVNSVQSLKDAGFTISKQRLDWVGLTFVDKSGRMGSPLKNVKVRQAINMAFNRPALLQAIAKGNGEVTEQIFASFYPGYDQKLDSTYPYDVAKAKALLAEAGYPNGFELSMPTNAAFGTIAPAAIKQSLADIGIIVNYTDVPIAQLFFQMQMPKFPAYYMSLGRQPEPYVLVKTQISRDGAWNPAGYGDVKTDALIAKIQKAKTPKEAAGYYKALNSYIVKQAWFAPIYQVDLTFGSSKNVKVNLQGGNAVPYLLYGITPA